MDGRHLTDRQRIWLKHVETCAASGGSMKAYAEEHGFDLQSFYLWKGHLKKLGLVAGRPDQAIPRLQVLPPGAPSCSAPAHQSHDRRTRIELSNGITIEAPHDIDIVWLERDAVDFRKGGINGLSVLVEEQLSHDPFSGQLFVFVNKARDKVKILYWERAGFCMWQKRLEREVFKWPDHLDGNVLTLDGQQLNWLLDGYDLKAMRPHRSLRYSTVL